MSATFAAYDALLDIVRDVAEAQAAATRVLDGPEDVNESVPRFVMLGIDDAQKASSTSTAIDSGDTDWISMGAFDQSERFVIRGCYVTWDGKVNFKARRAEAAAFFAALGAALNPHTVTGQTLSGNADVLGSAGVARLVIARWTHSRTRGAGLQVPFGVVCDTYPSN